MGGPTPVSEDSYGVVYATVVAEMIISGATIAAEIATAVGIDHHFLTNFQISHRGTNRVDRAAKFVAEGEMAILLARERSLKRIPFSTMFDTFFSPRARG